MNDDVIHLLKIFEVALLASVKFAIAPFEAERQGFNFKEAFFITTAGGIAGIIAFTFVGKIISYAWKKMIFFFKKPLNAENKPPKKFTWLNKLIVRIKMNFGLTGLLITTPSVITIPLGTIAVNHFYRKQGRNVLLMMLSVILWSILLNGIAQYLKLSVYLPK